LEAFILLVAFVSGLFFRQLGYPPLLGYLLSGFAAHAFGLGNINDFQTIADLGILLLLFTIGLKLNLRRMRSPRTLGVTLLHTGLVVPLTAMVIVTSSLVFPLLALDNTFDAWVLALALSFSSTVFAVKMFEERGEEGSLQAEIAIGILIFQDLLAVGYLILSADKLPSLWALLLMALPLLQPLLMRLLVAAGHDELLILFGISLALCGAELFELVNLKGGLGALVFGVLIGNCNKSTELYRGLIGFKDLFLIGFFLQIGYYGLPSGPMILVALVLAILIFLRPLIYFFLFVAFGLRARTAMLSGLSLFNYSEFGLIVAALAVANHQLPSEWLTTLALALSLSFFIATPFNTRVHSLYSRYAGFLNRFERSERLPEEKLPDLGDAEIIILGMGRVGWGAYQQLRATFGNNLIGVEVNYAKAQQLSANGVPCIHGDGMDRDFWQRVAMHKRKLILVSLNSFRENMAVVRLARQLKFANILAVTCRYPDELKQLEAEGCIPFYLYQDVGNSFAEHVMEQWRQKGLSPLARK